MSLADRIADVVTSHSKIVLVALLLTTALVGAGMPMVDDDSSLDQFESESPEAQAAEEIDDRFGSEARENTTSIQLIHRGDAAEVNVLDREGLIDSLEFQQTLRNNESIDETLVEEDPITGVENIVAMTAHTQQRVAELENRSEELAEEGEELQALGEELAERGEELEERGQELAEREAELEARSDALEAGIDEARDIQREYEELNATTDEDDPEYEQRAAELEAAFDDLIEETTETADLDEEQAAAYEERVQQARAIEAGLFEIEQATDDPESVPEYQELNEDLEGVYTAATMGVLQEEYEQLESDFEAFEEDQQTLEEERAELEERQEELEDAQAELEDDWAALEADDEDDEGLSLEEQIETLEEIDDEAFEDALEASLSEGDDEGEDGAALAFMPSDFEPGSTEADARMTVISQEIAGDAATEMGATDDEGVLETQLDVRDLAVEHDHEYVVFGVGIISDEIDRSMGDSLAIVGPLALAFVVAALLIAYRDPLDIVLGVVGILVVLIWTFGFMGWTGIAFNQMMVAVPVLLIGLSIDYAIHVFMRHREQREVLRTSEKQTGSEVTREQRDPDETTDTVRGSMTVALAGVGVALVWVTATTAIGFLANLVSPIAPIREFAIVSSVGIVTALIVFGALIPAAKVELDALLERWGFDRHKRAFGTGGGRFSDVLSVGSVAARRIPLVLLVAVLLLTAGGVYGASQVDTSFEEEDFLAESPPEWTEHLPGGMSPGEYQAADDLEYVNEHFQRDDLQAEILVEGDVADGDVLDRLADAQGEAADSPVAYTTATGDADVEGPLAVMNETAARNDSFDERLRAADTTGDGIPDENVSALYDELFEVNEEGASEVLNRTDDGTYEAARLLIGVDGDATFGNVTAEMRDVAATIDDDDVGDERADWANGQDDGTADDDDGAAAAGGVSAIATGDPIVNYIVEQDLFDTVIQSLAVTLVAAFVFLTVAYWMTGNGAALGAVTLLPVAFAVSWILGTMYLLGMPFNVLTGMITSLTIGLGVAYSIHVSARYTLELERQGNAWAAMHTTVTGTGGALLGSAATTIGGFGTLAFAILPALRQFGIITALTIAYAFVASVVVLPTLLVLWTRYFGPDVSFDVGTDRPATPASDGGVPADPPAESERTPDDADDVQGGDRE
ncbi:MMPL family transporter [Halopiger goleimassiliensis]|uniref:MMPL family transporter n=1 Tax=Halopiger goleimassiliensis TaxID=1293048 RepID=UPI000677DA1B|nr:MMPL family transporter [Halopiger goleimassiliensis]